jgi:hypothetical protein
MGRLCAIFDFAIFDCAIFDVRSSDDQARLRRSPATVNGGPDAVILSNAARPPEARPSVLVIKDQSMHPDHYNEARDEAGRGSLGPIARQARESGT